MAVSNPEDTTEAIQAVELDSSGQPALDISRENILQDQYDRADVYTDSRSHWMSTRGKQLYGDYFKYLVGLRPPQAVLYCDLADKEVVPCRAVIEFAGRLARQLIDADEDMLRHNNGVPQSPLAGHENEILHYTSADDFKGGNKNSTIPSSIIDHAKDGLDFAFTTVAGLAIDAVQHYAQPIGHGQVSLDAITATLRNPDCEQVVDALSITGFATIQSGNAPDAISPNLNKYKERVGYPTHRPAVILGRRIRTIQEFADVPMHIDPIFEAALTHRLRQQNRWIAKLTDDPSIQDPNDYQLYVRHGGMRGFSRGCPVAHGDTFGPLLTYLADSIQASRTPTKNE